MHRRGKRRPSQFHDDVEPAVRAAASAAAPAPAAAAPAPAAADGTKVFSTFAGFVEVVDILVKEGESVVKGQVIAAVEAMKAKHDIKAPCDGTIDRYTC